MDVTRDNNTMQHKKDDNDNNGINGDNSNSETMRFQNAVWPESLPEPKEEHIFTLLCGNTHVNWSCTWELVIKFKLIGVRVRLFYFIVCGGLLYYRRFMERIN
jgi:hypothetical protein